MADGAREKVFDALNDSPKVVEKLAVAVVPCGGGWKVEPAIVPCNWRLSPQFCQREAFLDLALPAVILFVAHDASFLSRVRLLHVGSLWIRFTILPEGFPLRVHTTRR